MSVNIGGCEDTDSLFEGIIKIGSIIILGFILKECFENRNKETVTQEGKKLVQWRNMHLTVTFP